MSNLNNLTNRANILNGFVAQDVDETDATNHYYGFENEDGIAIIMRKVVATNSYRFSMSSAYDTAWTNKAGNAYVRVAQM